MQDSRSEAEGFHIRRETFALSLFWRKNNLSILDKARIKAEFKSNLHQAIRIKGNNSP